MKTKYPRLKAGGYAVSLIHITEVGANFIKIGDTKFPVGRTYKESFKSALEKFKIKIQA